jgi:hypothetical protein
MKEVNEEVGKQMFIDIFFWVVENRPDWLEECISRKKAELQDKRTPRKTKA